MEDSTPFLDDETFLKLAPDSEIATLLANMEDGPVTINIAEPVSVKEEEAVKQTPPSTTALTIPDQLTVAAINSMVTVSNVTDAMINEYRAITAALDKDKEDTRSDTCPPRFFVGKQVLIHSSVSDEDRLQMWGLLFVSCFLAVGRDDRTDVSHADTRSITTTSMFRKLRQWHLKPRVTGSSLRPEQSSRRRSQPSLVPRHLTWQPRMGVTGATSWRAPAPPQLQ
jgi:hypothetical protein